MKNLSDISIQYIKGVGPVRRKLFQNLGVETVEDLIYFFPRRYEDRSNIAPISMVKVGELQTVTGKVVAQGARRSWYTRKHVYETLIDDNSGRIFAVWFNQPYLDKYFQPGRQVVLYGKVDLYKNRLQMVSPEYELVEGEDDGNLNVGRIVPIYPLTRGMTQRYLRKVVRSCLDKYRDEMTDILPVPLRNKYRLSNVKRSLENIHFPESQELQESGLRRISFEEFFLFQISVIKRRMSIVAQEGFAHQIDLNLVNQFSQSFPFSLTAAQQRVIREISGDLQKPTPMLRLLQGDVGSGKTLVALFGCVAAFKNQKQAAIMAPTEILARQHYHNIQRMIQSGPFSDMRVDLLVSGLQKKNKNNIYEKLKLGLIDVLVGTHALLSELVDFANLSFVVIDEQHKFGVRQRALLTEKGQNPDVLVMTATPIPRTLTLTLYGDLDVSVIDELPKGRGRVKTHRYSSQEADEVYKIVRENIKKGQQAYVIYPIVEESEKLELKAAEAMFKQFSQDVFKDFRLGLVHGQMNKNLVAGVMNQFTEGQIDVLVATTVLEVGVDVPNASVMVIEHAERFGLAQLHQLRGRIGRGVVDSDCLLIAGPSTEDGEARLDAILSTHDGFKIAEQDLLIRGPGHYFGRHQHGLNELKFANPSTQIDILEMARKEAIELTHNDPNLNDPQNRVFKEIIQKRYPGYLDMVSSG